MIIRFRSRELEDYYREVALARRKWGKVVGESYVVRITALFSIEEVSDLYKIPSIRFHALSGNRSGQHALTIHGKWRLIVRVQEETSTLVIEEVSNHYD